ncbi:MAG: outer membrane beta-barrel domain-containing protein [Myxococcales bacterium]|nr:outer membrane beta-barrel domain-containing protein [Myxococcales bacterium]
MRNPGWPATLATLALGAASARAEAPLPARAVQNRAHTQTHEFTVAVGTLPLDAFRKGLTLSGGYTLHFSDRWAWEAVQYTYSYPISTDLEDELRAYDLRPTPFERLESYVATNVVLKPLYFKGAWFNEHLTYGELLLLAGGGYGWLTRTQRPMVDVGVATRVYATDWVSLRLDVRGLSFFNADDLHNELWIGLGASL